MFYVLCYVSCSMQYTLSESDVTQSINNVICTTWAISVVSKSCFHNIRDLRRIPIVLLIKQLPAPLLYSSLIHSKIDYCNFLLLNLPATQTNRLQLVLNFAQLFHSTVHFFFCSRFFTKRFTPRNYYRLCLYFDVR